LDLALPLRAVDEMMAATRAEGTAAGMTDAANNNDYPAPGDRGLLSNLRGDISGGLSCAIVALPVAISCGVIAFAPMGVGFAAYGALAGLNAAIFITIVAALLGGSPLQISGPKSSLAVILASVMAGLVVDPLMPEDPGQRASLAIVLTFLCVVMAGVMQMLFGLFRLGNLIKFVPMPVTAGFMNGLAVIIVISQLPLFIKSEGFNLDILLHEDVALRPKAAAVALVTVIAMWLARLWLRRGGDALLAVAVGTGAYYVVAEFAGPADLGGVIGPIVQHMPYPRQLQNFAEVFRDPNFDLLLVSLMPSALVIALLGSIESLLSATAMDSHRVRRHDSNRELLAQGVAGIVSGVFGGLAGGGSAARSAASYDAGGRTRLASIVSALFFLLVVTVMGDLVARIPLAVTGGVLFVYAFRMVDGWTRQLISKMGKLKGISERREVALNLMVVGLVTVLTVTTDLIVAIAVGFAVASFQFIVHAGQAPIHRRLSGDQLQSKNARPIVDMDLLRREGALIGIVEARGAIFFGSAERLAEQLEQLAETADWVIVDLRRVTEIDATGAHILRRFDRFLKLQKKTLLLSHLAEDSHILGFLRDMEVIPHDMEGRIFTDLDGALAWAENQLLAGFGAGFAVGEEQALADMEVLAGLTSKQLEVLEAAMTRETHGRGQRLFEERSPGDAMYFLAQGSVSVKGRIAGGAREVRFAGIGPGVVFGEMAILGEIPRTASIDADSQVICYKLTRESFENLVRDRPDLVIRLLLNLGRQSAHRLEMTSAEVRALAE
jgi:SulP family sulfate permease